MQKKKKDTIVHEYLTSATVHIKYKQWQQKDSANKRFFLIYELFKLLRWSNFLPFTVTLCYSVNLINKTPKYISCHKRGYAHTTS